MLYEVITDCNDNDNAIYPGAEELCDDKDNDCNGVVDDNEKQYDYDGDGDGYDNPAIFMLACTMPSGYVLHEPFV